MAGKLIAQPAPVSKLREALSWRKIPSLDGLRAVAVTLVILHHMEVRFIPDGRGVLTFFVLSGFLITWMMLNEQERDGTISVRNFYVRRVLRIFPAFYIFLGLSLVGRLISAGWPTTSTLYDYLSAFTYTCNYRFGLTPQIVHTSRHTWALAVEEQFYLLWPCIFLAFQNDLRRLTRFLVAAIVFVDLYRLLLFFKFHVQEKYLDFAFDCRADHILIGCLLAVLLKRGVLTPFWNFLTAYSGISLASLGLIVVSIDASFRFHLAYRFGIGFIIDPILTALLLVQLIAWGDSWLWGWLNWPITRYVGQVSYGMFLYHMLAYRIVTSVLGRHFLWMDVFAVWTIALLMGAASFHIIELRALRLKSKFHSRPVRSAGPLVESFELSPS